MLNVLGPRWWLKTQEAAEALGGAAVTTQTTFPYLNEPLPKDKEERGFATFWVPTSGHCRKHPFLG